MIFNLNIKNLFVVFSLTKSLENINIFEYVVSLSYFDLKSLFVNS